jgi:Holliday junction resolvase RusA-like endonuclease
VIDASFEIPLPPRGKDRPRVTRSGHAYTPAATRKWESALALMAQDKLPIEVIDEPVRVDVLAVVPRPKRLLRRSDPDGLIWAPVKPDADNVLKSTLDALKAFWRDDALVVDTRILKAYAERAGRPRMVIRIRSAAGVSNAIEEVFE